MSKKRYYKFKPMREKRFFFTFYEKLYWSEAYQELTPAARNLFMCFFAELRFTLKKRKKTFTNNGQISFTEIEFKKQGLGASQTYISARNKLIEVGFIKMTHRGGMTRGDMATYKLLFLNDTPTIEQRWQRYPNENWAHEIPSNKNYVVGKSTRFKKSKATLKNKSVKK